LDAKPEDATPWIQRVKQEETALILSGLVSSLDGTQRIRDNVARLSLP